MRNVPLFILSFVLLGCSNAAVAATCTGAADCRACKNCKYCKHCKAGGSCGVCAPAASSPVAPAVQPPPPPPAKPAAQPAQQPEKAVEVPAANAEWRTVARVVDGDTVILDGDERVRLRGIDSPEASDSGKLLEDAKNAEMDKEKVKALGTRAKDYAKGLLEGKKVKLEYEEQRKDQYGRTLAYLRLEDNRDANAEIVKAGYATVYVAAPFNRQTDYLKFAKEARDAKDGLWPDVGKLWSLPDRIQPPAK